MPEDDTRGAEIRRSALRGAGWAAGFSAVMGVAALARGGPSTMVKGPIRVFPRGRELGAELLERTRDLYAEAQAEHAGADRPEGSEDRPPPGGSGLRPSLCGRAGARRPGRGRQAIGAREATLAHRTLTAWSPLRGRRR